MSLSEYRRKVDRLLSEYRSTKDRLRKERSEKERLSERIKTLDEAQSLAQTVAEQIQIQAHERIAEIVTKALSIFEEPYEFRIEFKKSRGKTEAVLLFERDGIQIDPLGASGGGVVDVAAFALRLACLVLRPELSRVLVLDEPFRFVSREYRPRLRQLLETLSKDLGVQFVTITHDPELVTGERIDINLL